MHTQSPMPPEVPNLAAQNQATLKAAVPPTSRTRTVALLLIAIVLIAVIAWLSRSRMNLDWHSLREQFYAVSWARVAIGIALIYVCFVLRAARWSVLLAPMRKTSTWQLLPSQVLGFTGVAIFGRVADLSRPYMIAHRTDTPVTTQIAIYSIERAFDLAAAATLFSLALAFAPASTPHHQAFARAGILSIVATLLLAATAITIRLAGDRLAHLIERLLSPLSAKFAAKASARVLDLQSGFGAISTFGEFAAAMSLSLIMWAGIAGCYLMGTTAFRATPELAGFSISATMLVMATGMGGSVVQLPVLGWFTQVALFATTMHALFGVPVENATACAALIFTMTNLSVIPGGLLVAQLQGTGLRGAINLQ
jgi:glycosyltransferase 2 family protein